MNEEKEPMWLVKSATRVLGPFSKKQVAELLRSKQINIIDEIKSPTTRWTFIRENLYFLEVVKQIREEQDSLNEKTVNSKTVTQMTKTNDVHETVTDTDLSEQTSDAIPIDVPAREEASLSFKNVNINSDSNVQDVTPVKEVEDVKPKKIISTTKTYGSSKDQKFQHETQRNFNGLYIFIIALILLSGGGFYFYKRYQEYQKNLANIVSVQKVRALYAAGLYEQAYGAYKQLPLDYIDADLEALFLPLSLQIDKQTVGSRRLADKLLQQTTIGAGTRSEAWIVIALSHMMDGNYEKSLEALDEVQKIEKTNGYVKTLKALIAYRQRELNKARTLVADLESNPNWAFNLYLKLVVYIDSAKESLMGETSTRIDILNHEVRDYLSMGHGFLASEINFLSFVLNKKLNRTNQFQKSFETIFSRPLREFDNYLKDPLLDWSILNWESMQRYCKESFDPQSEDVRQSLGLSVCALEAGRLSEADTLLKNIQPVAGLKPEFLHLRAQWLIAQKSMDELASLANMNEWKETLAAKYAQAYHCVYQTTGKSCQVPALDELIASEEYKVPALYLKARSFKADQPKEALALIKKILEIEPGYFPALELRSAIEGHR